MKIINKISFTDDLTKSFLQNATLEEIREAASRLCRDYLNGQWKSISAKDIIIERISGGLSNFLYYVSLPEETRDKNSNSNLCNLQTFINSSKRQRKDSVTCGDEPQEVLLRIYGQTHGEHALETMITESVVFALLSERNLGPKLHGIFPGGRIEQFIPARPLLTSELSDFKTSIKIAQKMGEIHSLNIPVSKEPEWIWNTMRRWLKSLHSILADINPLHEEKPEVQELKRIDFEKEVQWVHALVGKGNYPVVFCHNDLQEGNILLREETSRSPEPDQTRKRLIASNNGYTVTNSSDSILRNDLEDCEPDLIIIDFEYCAYNYRGFDLANHFIEWTLDYSNKEFPFYFHNKHQYPTKQQRLDFISSYLKKQNESIDNYFPSLEEMEKVEHEIRTFSLICHLFWALWSIVNVHQNIEFGYWEYGVSRIREYFLLKERLDAGLDL